MKKLTITLVVLSAISFNAVSREGSKPSSGKVLVFESGKNKLPDQYGVRQYRIPHLTKGPNGESIACVAGRTHQAGDNGHTTSVFAISKDGGKTWEHIRFESDYSKPTPKGQFPMTSRTNEVQVEWSPILKEYVAIYTHKYKCYFIKSKDLRTWGKPTLIPHQEELYRSWPSPSSMHVEEDGTIFFNLVTVKTKAEEKKRNRFVMSFWTKDAVTFEASEQAIVSSGECNGMKMSNGKYFYAARVIKGKEKNRHLFTYDKEKKKWSEGRDLPVPTHRSCEQDLLIDGDKIYLSAPLGKGRKNGCIYLSEDLGKTWKVHCKLPKDEVFGYSSIILLADGNIGILYEDKTAPENNLDIMFRVIKNK